MAPYVPEEVDVFSIPHSRMKELVNAYVEMIQKTNFTSDLELQLLLESLLRTFMEFKMHEQIENQFIMRKLKNKLRDLSIKNTAVCNCHSDDSLSEMMNFIEGGYRKKTEQDRLNFGIKLKQALEEFTDSFLPHMQEEEEVFQPLLLQYFSYEELRDLRLKVIQQHIKKEQIQLLKEQELAAAKQGKEARFAAKLQKEKQDKDEKSEVENLQESEKHCYISNLPPEIMIKVFSHLDPRDLGHCRRVNHEWSRLAVAPELWREIHPVQWAQGNWQHRYDDSSDDDDDDDDYDCDESDEEYNVIDDVILDESGASDSEDMSQNQQQIQTEAEMLTGLVKHVLPKAGRGVRRLVLKHSKTLTNGMLTKMLQLCPNVEVLDLTQTKISDLGLQLLGKFGVGSQLKRIVLSGCANVTDATVVRIAMAQHQSLKVQREGPLYCGRKPEAEHTVTLHTTPKRKHHNISADQKWGNESIQSDVDFETESGFEVDTEYCCQETNGGGCCEEIVKQVENMNPRDCLCEAYFNECRQSIEGGCDMKITTTCRKSEPEASKHVAPLDNMSTKEKNNTRSAGVAYHRSNGITAVSHNTANSRNIQPEENRDVIKCCGQSDVTVKEGCCRSAAVKKDPDSDLDLSALSLNRHVPMVNENATSRYDHNEVPMLVDMREKPKSEPNPFAKNRNGEAALAVGDDLDSAVKWRNIHMGDNMARVGVSDKKSGDCHPSCCGDNTTTNFMEPGAIEECIPKTLLMTGRDVTLDERTERPAFGLEYLNLSGCFQITDVGLRALARIGTFPRLESLDLSGCMRVSGDGMAALVSVCPGLSSGLYYCDNIADGPLSDTAGGCRNVECGARVCCRSGQY